MPARRSGCRARGLLHLQQAEEEAAAEGEQKILRLGVKEVEEVGVAERLHRLRMGVEVEVAVGYGCFLRLLLVD